MKINKGLSIAASLLATTLSQNTALAGRDDFPSFFEENTLLYLEIPSVPRIREDWKENPFHELYQREEVKTFVDGLIETLKSDKDFEEGMNEMSDLFGADEDNEILEGLLGGQIALGISRFDMFAHLPFPGARSADDQTAKLDAPAPDMWLVFNHEDEDLYSKLVDNMKEKEDEYVEYEDFFIILADELTVAFNEEIVLLTNTEETAKSFIDRFLSRDSQPTLADLEHFQKSFLRLYEDSEIFYYLDLSFISELAEKAAALYEKQITPLVQQGQLAPTATILEALGLDALKGISGGVDMDPSELRMKSLLMVESNNGFFGRFFGHYGNSLPDTRFLSEDLSQAMVSSYDISGMLHDLENTIFAISPFAGQMYQMQKEATEQQLSVRLDEALIDNFSGSFYLASGETPNTSATDLMAEDFPGMETLLNQGNTYILGINDRVALEALLDSLRAGFDPQGRFNKQDFLGVSHYSMQNAGASLGPSIFISDQHLIFEQNNPDFAKLVVSMMQNPGRPIFERRDVRDAFNELPADPISVTYNDAEKLLSTFTTTISKFLPILTEQANDADTDEENETEKPMADLPEIPIIDDFSYFSITTAYKENDDLYQEGILRPKSE